VSPDLTVCVLVQPPVDAPVVVAVPVADVVTLPEEVETLLVLVVEVLVVLVVVVDVPERAGLYQFAAGSPKQVPTVTGFFPLARTAASTSGTRVLTVSAYTSCIRTIEPPALSPALKLLIAAV